jgi:hypothetical protein
VSPTDPLLVVSSTEVAVTVTVNMAMTSSGAVYVAVSVELGRILPQLLGQFGPDKLQVTFVFVALVTFALITSLPPDGTFVAPPAVVSVTLMSSMMSPPSPPLQAVKADNTTRTRAHSQTKCFIVSRQARNGRASGKTRAARGQRCPASQSVRAASALRKVSTPMRRPGRLIGDRCIARFMPTSPCVASPSTRSKGGSMDLGRAVHYGAHPELPVVGRKW